MLKTTTLDFKDIKRGIIEQFLICMDLKKAMFLTGLTEKEIEDIVGRFRLNSFRGGELRGEICLMVDDSIVIRDAHTREVIWRKTYS